MLAQLLSIPSPPQCWSQAVVRVSTPRMYPQSRSYKSYFYLRWKEILLLLKESGEIDITSTFESSHNFPLVRVLHTFKE